VRVVTLPVGGRAEELRLWSMRSRRRPMAAAMTHTTSVAKPVRAHSDAQHPTGYRAPAFVQHGPPDGRETHSDAVSSSCPAECSVIEQVSLTAKTVGVACSWIPVLTTVT